MLIEAADEKFQILYAKKLINNKKHSRNDKNPWNTFPHSNEKIFPKIDDEKLKL